MTTGETPRLPIPGRLNVLLSIGAFSACAALLVAASRATSWAVLLAAAVAFSFVANTVFSLLHESVHGVFSRSRAVNDAFGVVSAAFFPTGFGFQRICHLGHHRRNRTEAELFEVYGPSDSRLLKALQLYGILTGLYWLLPPLGSLLYLVSPSLLTGGPLRRPGSRLFGRSGADAMLSGFDADVPASRIRLEILFSLAFQAALIAGLGLTAKGWLACYAAFALNWSSLQYADHAFSVRDVTHGAWNLRVPRLVRALFLNYHHHLAHHQHPEVSWVHLGRFVDPAVPRPSFLEIWLRMWRGPVPDAAPPFDPAGRPLAEKA